MRSGELNTHLGVWEKLPKHLHNHQLYSNSEVLSNMRTSHAGWVQFYDSIWHGLIAVADLYSLTVDMEDCRHSRPLFSRQTVVFQRGKLGRMMMMMMMIFPMFISAGMSLLRGLGEYVCCMRVNPFGQGRLADDTQMKLSEMQSWRRIGLQGHTHTQWRPDSICILFHLSLSVCYSELW